MAGIISALPCTVRAFHTSYYPHKIFSSFFRLTRAELLCLPTPVRGGHSNRNPRRTLKTIHTPFFTLQIRSWLLLYTWYIIKNEKKASAVRTRISSKPILASCVGYFDRVQRVLFYVTSSRTLSPYWGGQNLTALEPSECRNMWLL